MHMAVEPKPARHIMSSSPTTDVSNLLRRALPKPVKLALRPALSRALDLRFWVKYGFPPPPPTTDQVGYEVLLEFICSRDLISIPGDFVEIGAFRGGGTYKLSKFLQKKGSQKKVFAVDCFDIQVDQTKNTDGRTMAQLYEETLKGKNQRLVFDMVTAGNPNIFVIAGDSKAVELPARAVCFGFVDGNHSEEYVVNDFYLVWKKLSPGGTIAFHDYGYDLPGVTATIDALCSQHSSDISEVHVDNRHHVIYIRKGAQG